MRRYDPFGLSHNRKKYTYVYSLYFQLSYLRQLINSYQLICEIAKDNKDERHYLYLAEVPVVIPFF